NALIVERLRIKRAHAKFAELLRQGCCEQLEVDLKIGDFAPLVAPEPQAPRPLPDLPSPPVAQGAAPKTQETILLGRRIAPDKVRLLSSVTEEENSLVVEGQVFALEQLTLKSGRVKVKFAVSDT